MNASSLVRMLFCAQLLGIAGCTARYPMGLSKQQWDALPPAQQAEYQAKQYAMDMEIQRQRETQRLEQERIAREQAQARTEATRQAYANARYGDIVNVVVQGGSIAWNGRSYPYEPVSFDLIKGESKCVDIRGRGLQTIATRYQVRLAEDGNTIYFDEASRQRTVLVNHDWEHGEIYQPSRTMNDAGVALSGMTIFVKLKNLAGALQRIIIENR